jgi:hypothetical protein
MPKMSIAWMIEIKVVSLPPLLWCEVAKAAPNLLSRHPEPRP